MGRSGCGIRDRRKRAAEYETGAGVSFEEGLIRGAPASGILTAIWRGGFRGEVSRRASLASATGGIMTLRIGGLVLVVFGVTGCLRTPRDGGNTRPTRCMADAECYDALGSGYSCVGGQCLRTDTGSDASPDARQSSDAGQSSVPDAAPMSVHVGEPITPRSSHTDDCDFGARSGDIIRLVADVGAAGVAVDTAYVYFSTLEGGYFTDRAGDIPGTASLWRLPRCGGTAEALGSTFSFATTEEWTGALAESDSALHVLADHLYRVSKTDGARLDLQISSDCVADFAASPDSVFVYDTCNGNILRANSADTSLRVVVDHVLTSPYVSNSLARLAVGNALYFTMPDGVMRWAPESTSAELVYPTSAGVWRMAADDRGLMMLNREPPLPGYSSSAVGLAYVPAAGGSAKQLIPASDWGLVHDFIVVDSGRAFFQPALPPDVATGIGGLAMQPTDGSSPGYLFAASRYVDSLAAYGERLYWAEQGSVLTGVRQPARVPIPDATPPRWRLDGTVGSSTVDAIGLDPAGNALTLGYGPVPSQFLPAQLITKLDAQGQQLSSTVVSWLGQTVVDSAGTLTAISGTSATLSASRLTSDGLVLWSAALPGFQASTLTTDANGNLYCVAGGLDSTGTSTVPVLTRVDTNGSVSWTVALGALSDVTVFTPRAIAAVGTDGVVLEGDQNGPIDFGAGLLDPQGIRPSTAILRFGPDGLLRWSRLVKGMDSISLPAATAGSADGRSVAFGQTRDFIDVGTGPVYVKRALERFAAIVEYDASGGVSWVRLVDRGAGNIALGSAGEIYLGIDGCSSCIVAFDSSGATGSIMNGPGIAKLDPLGNFLWSRSFSGDGLMPLLSVGTTGVLVGGTVNPGLTNQTAFVALFDP